MAIETINYNPFYLVKTAKEVKAEAKKELAEYRRTGIPQNGAIEDLDMDFSNLGPKPIEKKKSKV